MKTFLTTAAVVALTSSAGIANTMKIIIGDMDCFGLNIACPTERTAPQPTFSSTGVNPFPTEDQRSASEAASTNGAENTDIFGEIGSLDFTFSLAPLVADRVISNATLSTKVWGIDFALNQFDGLGNKQGDEFEGAHFKVNGTTVGEFVGGTNAITDLSFAFDASLLNFGGSNTLQLIPELDQIQFSNSFFTGQDAFAVDFMSVSFDDNLAPIPLPAGLPLLLAGLAGLGLAARRRR